MISDLYESRHVIFNKLKNYLCVDWNEAIGMSENIYIVENISKV